ncbi:hypothetical protein [Sphingobacterium chungjuense]|uniref:hypothetical protein n=1 Tax=Sphingobacterium chungjuense TaxID=2675553 RepID=UPI00140D4C56|nr:hypothetical protein [Sphingobacterium chungjuense]
MKTQKCFTYILIILVSAFNLVSCEVSTAPVPHTYHFFLDFSEVSTLDSLQQIDLDKLKANVIAKDKAGKTVLTSFDVVNGKDNPVLAVQSTTPPSDILDWISYSIQSAELMGESAVHILETKWRFSNNNTHLSEITLDGIALPPSQYNAMMYYTIPKP